MLRRFANFVRSALPLCTFRSKNFKHIQLAKVELLICLVKKNWRVDSGDMGGSNAPLFGVKVIGACADVLHLAEGMTHEGDGDLAMWRVVGQVQSFTTEIGNGLGVG